jgi:hypothetical protein
MAITLTTKGNREMTDAEKIAQIREALEEQNKKERAIENEWISGEINANQRSAKIYQDLREMEAEIKQIVS